MMRDNDQPAMPLSPALFHILMALAGHDLHGYAIMQEISRQTDGKYTLGPGTLYDNLQKVIFRRWVLDLGHRPEDDDPRRRYYRLTSLGVSALAAEVTRLEGVISGAKARLRTLKPRRA